MGVNSSTSSLVSSSPSPVTSGPIHTPRPSTTITSTAAAIPNALPRQAASALPAVPVEPANPATPGALGQTPSTAAGPAKRKRSSTAASSRRAAAAAGARPSVNDLAKNAGLATISPLLPTSTSKLPLAIDLSAQLAAGVKPTAAKDSKKSQVQLARSLQDAAFNVSNAPKSGMETVMNSLPEKKVTSTATKAVPAFLNKLYNMVNDESSNLIRWSDDGQAFIVENHEEFAREVLPRFFKHNNFSSFVRQLNMYGFHKVPHLQSGALVADEEPENWEFANPHFQRNQPDLLCLVTRKKGTITDREEGQVDTAALLQEIAAIKRHQLTISADMKSIQRENQVLWTESMAIREQHQRQQQTIDKILRFLATVFLSRKRSGAVQQTPNPKRQKFLLKELGESPESDTPSPPSNFTQQFSTPSASPAPVTTATPVYTPSPTNPLLDSSDLNDYTSLLDPKLLPNADPNSVEILDLFKSPELPSLTSDYSPSESQSRKSFSNHLDEASSSMATGKRVPSNGIPRHMSRINESVKSLKEEMEIMDDQLHATASLLGMDSSFTALDAETLASLQSSLESPHAPDWISSLMANTSSTGKLDPSSGSFGTTEALLSGFGSNDVHDLATVLETLAPLNQQGTVPRTEDAWDQKIRAHGQTRSQSATDGQNAGAGNMPTSLAALGVLHPPGKADAVRLPARSPVAPALGQTLSIALDGDDAIYADDFADLVMEDADSIDLGLL